MSRVPPSAKHFSKHPAEVREDSCHTLPRRAEDENVRSTKAELYCEDDNAYDSNAVRVMMDGKKVGYLSRVVAAHYRSLISTAGFGKATGRCKARIYGGGEGKPSYGVWLDI
jgi:hypothetical protein